jgi:recombination endonuclease VII
MDDEIVVIPLGMNVVVTLDASLKKYGLDEQGWLRILRDQGWVCAICEKPSSTGRYVVDHFHAPKFKDLSPEDKRSLIRCITCWFCNHAYLGRGITIAKAKNVLKVLEDFEARKPDPLPKPPPKVRNSKKKRPEAEL